MKVSAGKTPLGRVSDMPPGGMRRIHLDRGEVILPAGGLVVTK
jgi:hypothetical protein